MKHSWLACVCIVAGTALAQGPGAGRPDYADRLKPTNGWQRIARHPAPAPADPIGLATRRARDQRVDHLIGAPRPLFGPPVERSAGEGLESSTTGPDRVALPEIPDYGSRTVVIGSFTDYDTVLSESRRSIYSEMHIRVERVIKTDQANLVSDATINFLALGGAVRVGLSVVEHYLRPRAGALVPQHRYLLFLRYSPEGDTYDLWKSWELLDGRAMPCQEEDVLGAQRGTSQYAGMNEAEFIAAVSAAVGRESKPGR